MCVLQTIIRSVYKGIFVETTKSAAGRRVVDLDEKTVNIVRSNIGRQLLHRAKMGDAYHDTGLVFPNPLGEPVNPMRLTRAFQELAKKLGFKGARLHNLRHFHATVMLQSGASLLAGEQKAGTRQRKHHGRYLWAPAAGVAKRRQPTTLPELWKRGS